MSNNKVVILDGQFTPYDDSNPLPILITNIDELSGGGGISASGTPVNNQLAVWTSSSTIEGESALTFDSTTKYLTYLALTDDNSLLIAPNTTSGLVNSPYFAMRSYSTGAPLDFNFHVTRTGSTTYTFEITDTNGTPVSTWTHTGNLDVPGTITGSRLISDIATGTSPLSVSSSTVTTNLNADLWDGYHFSDYLDQAVKTTSSPTFSKILLTGATDPDLTTEGQLSWDSDDDALRGHDGTRQVVTAQVKKTIDFAVSLPASLPTATGRSTKSICVWFNNTGFTFNITKIYAMSDTDDYTFLLFKSSSATDIGTTNDTQIDSVACSTNGTSGFYADITSSFDNSTIETGKYLIFEHSSGTANALQVHIDGWLDANVD